MAPLFTLIGLGPFLLGALAQDDFRPSPLGRPASVQTLTPLVHEILPLDPRELKTPDNHEVFSASEENRTATRSDQHHGYIHEDLQDETDDDGGDGDHDGRAEHLGHFTR